ncbi:heavy-metal-associated domain-containing protein [Ramlibacter sp. PS4R-6]|uniref:heavy-metal-associated domain-containing protein n=1 Tax=Ramlibacter sp. PS4R-6 TaxID=3133438 RepID=UPI00403FBCE5
MIQFNIPQMSCGHCARAVTEAVKEVDPNATVDVDLASKQVSVVSTAERQEIVAALAEAGYAPAS